MIFTSASESLDETLGVDPAAHHTLPPAKRLPRFLISRFRFLDFLLRRSGSICHPFEMKRGVRVLQSQDIPQIDFKMAYLDTEDIAGVSFELVQSPGIPAEEEFQQALAAKGMAPRE